MTRTVNDITNWRTVTWAEIEDWARLRSVERGRTYCRERRVGRLGLASNGDLLAWVRGGTSYAVRVRLDARAGGNVLRSSCTCPMGDTGCKHAVAALLTFLDGLRHGHRVSLAEDEWAWPVPELEAQAEEELDIESEREAIGSALRWPIPSTCEEVMPHLRRLRELLLQSGRESEWEEYETQLRIEHSRRPRLLEVLDRLRSRRRVIPA